MGEELLMRRRSLHRAARAWLCALALAAGLSAQTPPEEPPPEEPPPVETEIELEEPEPPVTIDPESLPESLRVPVGGEPLAPAPPTDSDRLRRATGPLVTAVEIRSDAPLVLEEVVDSMAFGVGDRLTEDAVRRSLKNLHATGVASRISVLTRPAAPSGVGGVEVVLALWANVRVEAVRITGDLGKLDRRELQEALVQREGEPLVESRVIRGDFLLEERLQQAGYLDARVGLDVDLDRERRRATVTYQVEAGPRWQVGRVLFEGELGPFTAAELAQAIDLGPDDPFRSQALETAAEKLRRF
jgi:outer membrane protein assembly factor BamA